MRISLAEIRCNYLGFVRLANFWSEINKVRGSIVHVDCSAMSWLDAHMAASLGVIVEAARERGNELSFEGFSSEIADVLRRNRFLSPPVMDRQGTTIRYTEFGTSETDQFNEFIEDNLNRYEIPIMSRMLEDKFFEGINEIFVNSSMHSETKFGISCCGQFYPKRNILDFSIADGGIGIAENIRKRIGLNFEPDEAIDWAMQEGNTSRQLDVPGGLGLSIVKEFIEMNRGRFLVVSHSGYWSMGAGGVSMKVLPKPFPGTVATLEIRTDDDKSYYMIDEGDRRDEG